MKKNDMILPVPRGPFHRGRGNPKLHIVFWVGSHWAGPEKPPMCVKGRV